MSVYVDEMKPCIKSRGWPYKESCHLVSDSIIELHLFAKMIGMKRSWFQSRGTIPHYDLTYNRRSLAIHFGAIPIRSKKLLEMRRRK